MIRKSQEARGRSVNLSFQVSDFNKKTADLAKAEMIAQTYQITGLEDFGKGAQEIINEVKED